MYFVAVTPCAPGGWHRQLLKLGDDVTVRLGTPRLTVVAAAVYTADRLTPGKRLTQQQVADAASTVVPTTKNKIDRYNCALVDAYVAAKGPKIPMLFWSATQLPRPESFPQQITHSPVGDVF